MRRNRNISSIISGGPSIDLISAVERFVYRNPIDQNESVCFSEIDDDLLRIALEASRISENTALHKVLSNLAYIYFYLQLYDDLDWTDEYTDFAKYATEMFQHMNIPVPSEFRRKSPEEIIAARDQHRNLFLSGLQFFVNSAFAHLWTRKGFLFDFNTRLAEKISPLLKHEYPALAKDGQLPRETYFPKWLVDMIMLRERGLCHYCNCIVASPSIANQSYDIDHMTPIANGGTNDPTNLVLSCPSCNNKKRAKYQMMPDTFFWPKIT
ncbi:HNH endonuclease [Jeongeupia chitinilytica]|uniref:HNH endonuclease n=1 Tax=Jeongeupia chitinilytica TaxID=1041641 RepID=UPI0016750C79|nr:HNH endonuclease signature motif containing protein [Jeongeupia chitinilytica]